MSYMYRDVITPQGIQDPMRTTPRTTTPVSYSPLSGGLYAGLSGPSSSRSTNPAIRKNKKKNALPQQTLAINRLMEKESPLPRLIFRM